MGCGHEEEEGGDWMEDKRKGGVIRRKEGRKESWIDDRWKDGRMKNRGKQGWK